MEHEFLIALMVHEIFRCGEHSIDSLLRNRHTVQQQQRFDSIQCRFVSDFNSPQPKTDTPTLWIYIYIYMYIYMYIYIYNICIFIYDVYDIHIYTHIYIYISKHLRILVFRSWQIAIYHGTTFGYGRESASASKLSTPASPTSS